jgi:hypothetical protein
MSIGRVPAPRFERHASDSLVMYANYMVFACSNEKELDEVIVQKLAFLKIDMERAFIDTLH